MREKIRAPQSDRDPDEDEDEMDPEDVLKRAAREQFQSRHCRRPGSDFMPGQAKYSFGSANRSEKFAIHLGSNNWVVNGEHTASGKPLLANDMHLELTLPPIWYEVHLTAPEWNVKGFALPGAPTGRRRTQRPNRLGIH